MAQSILVVDDDQNILMTIQDILTAEGFPVRVARNGSEGLKSIEEEVPALIVLDLWMPLMDGQEMAHRLHQNGVLVPILVMSAIQAGDRIAHEIDAAGFIPKPFDVDRLINEVRRLLDQSRSEPEEPS